MFIVAYVRQKHIEYKNGEPQNVVADSIQGLWQYFFSLALFFSSSSFRSVLLVCFVSPSQSVIENVLTWMCVTCLCLCPRMPTTSTTIESYWHWRRVNTRKIVLCARVRSTTTKTDVNECENQTSATAMTTHESRDNNSNETYVNDEKNVHIECRCLRCCYSLCFFFFYCHRLNALLFFTVNFELWQFVAQTKTAFVQLFCICHFIIAWRWKFTVERVKVNEKCKHELLW